jgi:hypothetical protein
MEWKKQLLVVHGRKYPFRMKAKKPGGSCKTYEVTCRPFFPRPAARRSLSRNSSALSFSTRFDGIVYRTEVRTSKFVKVMLTTSIESAILLALPCFGLRASLLQVAKRPSIEHRGDRRPESNQVPVWKNPSFTRLDSRRIRLGQRLL